MNKGPQTEESLQAAADGNAALERGIEELRVKYELKAQHEAKLKEIEAQKQRTADALAGCAACEKERVDPTVDMTMEDTDLEALRQARMESLKSMAAAKKRHVESGGGEYREITEEDFLKEVSSRRECARTHAVGAALPAGHLHSLSLTRTQPLFNPFHHAHCLTPRSLRTTTWWCTFITRSLLHAR